MARHPSRSGVPSPGRTAPRRRPDNRRNTAPVRIETWHAAAGCLRPHGTAAARGKRLPARRVPRGVPAGRRSAVPSAAPCCMTEAGAFRRRVPKSSARRRGLAGLHGGRITGPRLLVAEGGAGRPPSLRQATQDVKAMRPCATRVQRKGSSPNWPLRPRPTGVRALLMPFALAAAADGPACPLRLVDQGVTAARPIRQPLLRPALSTHCCATSCGSKSGSSSAEIATTPCCTTRRRGGSTRFARRHRSNGAPSSPGGGAPPWCSREPARGRHSAINEQLRRPA